MNTFYVICREFQNMIFIELIIVHTYRIHGAHLYKSTTRRGSGIKFNFTSQSGLQILFYRDCLESDYIQ